MKYRTAKKVIMRMCCDPKQHYRWSTIDRALNAVCKYTPPWKQKLGKHNCWCSEMKQLWRITAREIWKWEW